MTNTSKRYRFKVENDFIGLDIDRIVENTVALVESVANDSSSAVFSGRQAILGHLPAVVPAGAELESVLVVGVKLTALLEVVMSAETLSSDSIV